MKRVLTALLTAGAGAAVFAACRKKSTCNAAIHPLLHGTSGRKAILAVSFGTSYRDTLEITIGAIEDTLRTAFPDYEVRRAFTSRVILHKLRQRDGLLIDDVPQALERLIADGFKTLVIQPTHIMNGSEYNEILELVRPYASRFETLRIAAPLLTSTQDYQDLVRILAAEFSLSDDTALVLMGHGTEHSADTAYAALAYHFLEGGHPRILVGTVEGYPALQDVIRHLEALHVHRILLTPLMVVAGDHANNDMAGSHPDSWKSVLESKGYAVDCILKGLGEYASIRQLYVSHTRDAIDALQ